MSTDTGKQFQLIEMVPVDKKLTKVIPTYMKDQKENAGNCRLVSLTSFRWDHGTDHPKCHQATVQDSERIRPSHQGFEKSQSCLINIMSF